MAFRLPVAAVVLVFSSCAHAALIASSRLEQCWNDGSQETLTDCDQRIVVSLAIAAGQSGSEEVHTVADASEASGERELMDAVRLSIFKTEAVVRYPVLPNAEHLQRLRPP